MNKHELEKYLSGVLGQEISVVDADPVFVRSVSLEPLGLTGNAVVYKNSADRKLHAVLVPFGIPFGDQKTATA